MKSQAIAFGGTLMDKDVCRQIQDVKVVRRIYKIHIITVLHQFSNSSIDVLYLHGRGSAIRLLLKYGYYELFITRIIMNCHNRANTALKMCTAKEKATRLADWHYL